MSKIASINTVDYENKNVQHAIDTIFDLLNIDEIIKPEYKVLIKPNLLMKRKPSEVTTTHPSLILAIINRLKALGIRNIVIADSPGGPYTKTLLTDIYKASGMYDVAMQTNVSLNLNTTADLMNSENSNCCKVFNIIKPVHEADFIISVGKVKTHGMTTMSGGVKNLFGCIPGLQKPEMHCRFNKVDEFCDMLVDLALCVKPDVTIMDGVIGMEGNGPSGGVPKQCGFIAGSRDVFALDVYLSKKIGLNPEEVPTIVASSKRKLCDINAGDVELLGDEEALNKIYSFKRPESVSVDFAQKVPKIFRRPANYIMKKVLVSRPYIIKQKCVGCGKCAESCPQNTINIKDRKASINYKNCIRCFCCHEMCPIKAIEMKRMINK